MTRRAAVIVNSHAAHGRAGRLWPRFEGRLRARLGEMTVRFTESAGHATRIAQELITSGYDRIIAVGGDGTASEVANGFLFDDRPINAAAELGILPIGTGADFQRTLGIPPDPDAAIEILANGKPKTIDVGKVKFVNPDGRERERYFINLTSFGIAGSIAVRAKNRLRALGGKAAFFWATLQAATTDRGRAVEIEFDGSGAWQTHFITNVAVGNGEFHGGGMHVCPRAILNDGLLDVTVIDYLNAFEVLRGIGALYSDNVYVHPKTHHRRVRRLAARSEAATWIEVDGEPLGRLPIEIEVLPQRLPIIMPRPEWTQRAPSSVLTPLPAQK